MIASQIKKETDHYVKYELEQLTKDVKKRTSRVYNHFDSKI